MARKFSELRAKMSPAARAESEREFRRIVEEMPLQKVREARHLTQASLANVMGVSQSEVSKIERRTDVYVSTLGSYVEAMGGKLEVSVVFPDGGIVKINQFEGLGEGETAAAVKTKTR
jgi:transcriptional regulator with XRE-family HTH domain